MKLNEKVMLMIAVVLITGILAIISVISIMVPSEYETLEFENAHRLEDLTKRFIEHEMETLEQLASDWSEWDAIYEFMEDKNEKFIISNFNHLSFEKNLLKAVAIVDTQNNPLFAVRYKDKETTNLDEKIVGQLLGSKVKTALMKLDNTYVWVTKKNIRDSEALKPSRGQIVFVREFNVESLKTLASGIDVEYSLQKSAQKGIFLAHDTTTIWIPLESADESPYDLVVKYNSGLKQLGSKTAFRLVILMSIITLTVTIVIYFSQERLIIRPVREITELLEKISDSGNLKLRLKVKGNDELSSMALMGNKMLENIEIMTRKLERLSKYDLATEVLNRNAGISLIREAIESSKTLDIALFFADLDGLKNVNDTLGHKVGDQYILDVVLLLKELYGEIGDIVRWGGDEFIILIYHVEPEMMKKYSSDLEAELIRFNKEKERPYKLSISWGYVAINPNYSLEQLIHEADMEMYRWKRHKKDNDDSLRYK